VQPALAHVARSRIRSKRPRTHNSTLATRIQDRTLDDKQRLAKLDRDCCAALLRIAKESVARLELAFGTRYSLCRLKSLNNIELKSHYLDTFAVGGQGCPARGARITRLPWLAALAIVVVKVRRERRWTSAGETPARELVRSTR